MNPKQEYGYSAVSDKPKTSHTIRPNRYIALRSEIQAMNPTEAPCSSSARTSNGQPNSSNI